MGELSGLRKAVERNNELLVEQNRLLREALSGRTERRSRIENLAGLHTPLKGGGDFVITPEPKRIYPELAVIPGEAEPHCRDDTNSHGDWEPEGA